MKTTAKFNQTTIAIISYLFVLLFTYAAVSKLLDFENFQVQLGQSPLISSFASWVSISIPAIELVIVMGLMIPKFRNFALYAFYMLMVMFTAYIYIVLNYSESIPCSCGGILEDMNWTEHLWFNIGFVVLAAAAILMQENKTGVLRKSLLFLITLTLLSAGTVVALFLISNKITRFHNSFIRNFPKAAYKTSELDLQFNSFYFAGQDHNRIYLGNYTAPLQIFYVQENKLIKEIKEIKLDKTERPFNAFQFRVNPPNFIAYDGTVSCFYTGKMSNWNAQLKYLSNQFIDQVVVMDTAKIAFREQTQAGTKVGTIDFANKNTISYGKGILQKQSDGIFDVDGKLLFDKSQKHIAYLYTYRNQFTVTDTELNIGFKGTTIDTITKAQITVAVLKTHNQQKLAQPPLKVNKMAVAYGNLLFVNSGIMGRFEPSEMWDIASIIDIYNLSNQSYIASMYVHDVHRKKMHNFTVEGNQLYALIDNTLVTYKLSTIITSNYKNNIE